MDHKLNRFRFSIRGLLLFVVLICIAVVLVQNYLARRQFEIVKAETAKKLVALNSSAAQNRAIRQALDLVTYDSRHDPRIAFASVEKSLIASKLESAGMGPHMLSVGWFDLERNVDTIRLGLKNGRHIDYKPQNECEFDALYCQVTLFLGPIGVEDGQEIESVSLIAENEIVSNSASPIFWHQAPNAD